MATEILAIGTSIARSSDVVVASGSSATLFLKITGGGTVSVRTLTPALALVQIKDSAGSYNTIGQLTDANPAVSIVSPGTYAVQRQQGGVAFGVEQG